LQDINGSGDQMDCVDTDMMGAGRPVDVVVPPATEGEIELAIAANGGKVVRLPNRFQVIDGGRSPDAPAAPKMWLCRTCEDDIGVATSVVEPVWQGPLRENGRVRLSSGTKRVVCTHCKMRGKLTFAD
jgi:hypothetical protein